MKKSDVKGGNKDATLVDAMTFSFSLINIMYCIAVLVSIKVSRSTHRHQAQITVVGTSILNKRLYELFMGHFLVEVNSVMKVEVETNKCEHIAYSNFFSSCLHMA